uniref:NADH dehydrogenase subunit 6 n=1 Tax=Psychomyia kalais TaxID=2904897 RepID=A0A9E8LQM0_9NEOP|nr:NADH dehydrogenase subunit 6 [Psychomyia kalais]UZZ44348.1 NADH dehydrogenase subunit 6 [Psychomyia kalais]
MYFLLMMSFIMTTLIFSLSKNPMILNFIIFIQLLNSCFFMNLLINKSWFSYLLFIMFIGGLMILFMYMCSISTNMKFKINFKFYIIMMMIMMIMLMITKYEMFNYKINYFNYSSSLIMNDYNFLFKLFNNNALMISLLTINMLFFMMIYTSKMILNLKGPLRKKY